MRAFLSIAMVWVGDVRICMANEHLQYRRGGRLVIRDIELGRTMSVDINQLALLTPIKTVTLRHCISAGALA